jgi:hypothetical protein
LAQKLKARAQKNGLAPEAWISARIVQELNKSEDTVSDETFRALAKSVIEDNRELLDRLAR